MLDKIYAVDQLSLSEKNKKLIYWILLNRNSLETLDYARLWGTATGAFSKENSNHLADKYYYKLRDIPEYPCNHFRAID